jgi:hypothetical protein
MEGASVNNVVFVDGDWCSKIVWRRGLRKKLQACELTAPSKLSHWRRTYEWQLQQTSQELDQAHFPCLNAAPASTCMHANDQFNLSLSLSLSLSIYIYIVYGQSWVCLLQNTTYTFLSMHGLGVSSSPRPKSGRLELWAWARARGFGLRDFLRVHSIWVRARISIMRYLCSTWRYEDVVGIVALFYS